MTPCRGDILQILRNEPMKNRTTLRIGGRVRELIIPESEEELMECAGRADLILGRGSNLLVADGELDICVVSTEMLRDIVFDGDKVTAGAGVTLTELAVKCAERGLGGLEFAHGIPGSVGGAIFMNAGAYGGEMKDVITSVRAITGGKIVDIPNAECGFSYRASRFQQGGIVASATFKLRRRDEGEIRAKMRELGDKRREKQPLEFPSAGSTFKRPEGYFAAALIEEAGLKGAAVGGAQVSEKHAGFLINRGGATFEDFTALMEKVQREVYSRSGVELEPEVRIIK